MSDIMASFDGEAARMVAEHAASKATEGFELSRLEAEGPGMKVALSAAAMLLNALRVTGSLKDEVKLGEIDIYLKKYE